MKPLNSINKHLQHHKRTASSDLEHRFKLLLAMAFTAFVMAMLVAGRPNRFTASAATFAGFPYSTPITLNNSGTQLWVTNPDPDNNSVTVLDATSDQGSVIREIKVGNEPNSIAINAND